jgi:uncharacterized coiled-coil protein SlyX
MRLKIDLLETETDLQRMTKMSINNTTAEMWDALRKKHSPIENNPLTNALKSYAAEAEKEAEDMVTAPRHYNTGNIECIDAIEESMSSIAFKGYLKGNCMKYLWRYDYKGKQVEDLKKAGWYLQKLTEMVIEENS